MYEAERGESGCEYWLIFGSKGNKWWDAVHVMRGKAKHQEMGVYTARWALLLIQFDSGWVQVDFRGVAFYQEEW